MTTTPDAISPPLSDAISEIPIWHGTTASYNNHRLRRESPDLLILETANRILKHGLLYTLVLAPITGVAAAWFGLPTLAVIGLTMVFGWGGICVLIAHYLAKTRGTRAEFNRSQGKWLFRQAFPEEQCRRPLANIVAVQVISFIVGSSWFERKMSYRLCQIVLVCRRPKDGTIERIKLISNTGRKVLPEIAAEIAEFLQVPLYRVENQILIPDQRSNDGAAG